MMGQKQWKVQVSNITDYYVCFCRLMSHVNIQSAVGKFTNNVLHCFLAAHFVLTYSIVHCVLEKKYPLKFFFYISLENV